MTPSRLLSPADVKQVMSRYLERLREHRDALNRLNVYPVPDGDTGTNMTLTVESVVAELGAAATMEEMSVAIAHGSLMGAQGNSGIILSQILRGLADAFRLEPAVGTFQLVDALEQASDAAYRAVGRPVEGTILTVLREASEAARETDTPEGESLADFLSRVYGRAEASLERTPELLPVLKEAGVVDAGGAGFLLLLAAFLEEVTGEDVVLPEAIFAAAAVTLLDTVPEEGSISGLRYEVMYLLDSEDPRAADLLKDAWSAIGDSIVVVGGDGTWNCHIHTDHIGEAIEAGIGIGRPNRIKVTDLLDQAEAESFHRAFEPLPEFGDAEVGVVAVAVGSGIVDLFRDGGAQGLVVGGQTMNPSVRDLLDVVEAVAAHTVVVLPNNKNIVPVASQLDALSTKRVLVVPTTSIAQGLAAMLAYLPGIDVDTLHSSMIDASDAVYSGEVTQAVRDAVTPAGAITSGDWLGVTNGEVSVIAGSCAQAAEGVLIELLDNDVEVVTIITGAEADTELTGKLRDWVIDSHDLEVDVVFGGQPLYPYLFGTE